jgi:hydrogenase/urease accessory protein HupE
MRTTARTRATGSGPFVLAAAALLMISSAALLAHDPGLSSLQVTWTGARVTAVLSVAVPDLEALSGGTSGDPLTAAGRLAAERIAIVVGGRTLPASVAGGRIADDTAHVRLTFPELAVTRTEVSVRSDVAAQLARGHRQLLTVLEGERVLVERLLDARSADVTVSMTPEDSAESSARGSTMAAASPIALFTLGVTHILSGYDHLVFLAGLLLAARSARQVLGVLTAFTAAHSITLALAALDVVHAPAAIVEPLIALSIAWVGLENLLPNRRVRVRWVVVFVFGLVHGFGFAEALTELGRGSSAGGLALALFAFNSGVEIGQIAVAAIVAPLIALVRTRPAWNRRLVPACSLLIVTAGAWWLIDRL